MSNIGKQPINIPEGVDVNIDTKLGSVTVKGKNGELFLEYNTIIKISEKNNVISVVRNSDDRNNRELHGLYRALINNMILGVSEGFSKELNFVGVGYGVEKKDLSSEIAFFPTRVLMQDFTGVPAIADLAAMRDALKLKQIDPK